MPTRKHSRNQTVWEGKRRRASGSEHCVHLYSSLSNWFPTTGNLPLTPCMAGGSADDISFAVDHRTLWPSLLLFYRKNDSVPWVLALVQALTQPCGRLVSYSWTGELIRKFTEFQWLINVRCGTVTTTCQLWSTKEGSWLWWLAGAGVLGRRLSGNWYMRDESWCWFNDYDDKE